MKLTYIIGQAEKPLSNLADHLERVFFSLLLCRSSFLQIWRTRTQFDCQGFHFRIFHNVMEKFDRGPDQKGGGGRILRAKQIMSICPSADKRAEIELYDVHLCFVYYSRWGFRDTCPDLLRIHINSRILKKNHCPFSFSFSMPFIEKTFLAAFFCFFLHPSCIWNKVNFCHCHGSTLLRWWVQVP